MKKKISNIWGVGLVVMLVTTLLLSAAPVSAGTLSWSSETIPETTGEVLAPGSDVNDFEVSGDAQTVYAVSPGNETITWEVTVAPTAATANASITTLT